MKYIVLFSIGLFVLACGGGVGPDKVTDSKSSSVNPINVEKAVKTKSSTKSSLKANETSSQDPTMTKEQLDKAKAIISKVTDKDIEALKAGKIYRSNCALCHGFKGKMKINGAKDLTKSTIPLHEAVAQVYFGKGLMNPYKGVLKDAEIVAVCQYIEKLRK